MKSIRFKIIIVVVPVISAFAVAMWLPNMLGTRRVYKEAYISGNFTAAERIVDIAAKGLQFFSFDSLTGMNEALSDYIAKHPETVYCYVTDRTPKVLYHAAADTNRYEPASDFSPAALTNAGQRIVSPRRDIFELILPVEFSSEIVGAVHVGITQSSINALLARSLLTALILLVTLLTAAVIVLAIILDRIVSRPLIELENMLHNIAEGDGDLRKRIVVRSTDEIGQLAGSFNTFAGKVQSLVALVKQNSASSHERASAFGDSMNEGAQTIQEIAATVSMVEKNVQQQNELVKKTDANNEAQRHGIAGIVRGIDDILASTNALKQVVENQSANVTEIASAIEEMSSTIISVTSVTEKARTSAAMLKDVTTQGKERMLKTTDIINGLLSSVGTINEFIGVIVSIAQQTNLLAMNAAIEAAHAGDQGKGFAVVAEEIRKLSDISNKQAGEANNSLKAIATKIKDAATELRETEKSFATLSSESENVFTITHEVKNAADEESKAVSEIVISISEVSKITQNVRSNYTAIHGSLNSMRETLTSVMESSGETTDSMKALRELSGSIAGSMGEMAVGAGELNRMTAKLLSLTKNMSESIDMLTETVTPYKTDDIDAALDPLLPPPRTTAK
ncbi:MAG: methyl-accepting chemotaxis protein [Spirochaetota bacterium]